MLRSSTLEISESPSYHHCTYISEPIRMDAFDDGFGGEGEVEVDPAAEFLAKEQEELGEIGKLPV